MCFVNQISYLSETNLNQKTNTMAKKNEVYKCPVCGNIVEVVVEGGGVLSCCGQPMKLLKENTNDGAKDEHPMTEAHHIQFIELVTEDGVLRKDLTPSDKPVAEFQTDAQNVFAREYCNLHGLWKS